MLKLIAKKSISYRSEFDSRGSSTPLGRWPGEYIYIYIYIIYNIDICIYTTIYIFVPAARQNGRNGQRQGSFSLGLGLIIYIVRSYRP